MPDKRSPSTSVSSSRSSASSSASKASAAAAAAAAAAVAADSLSRTSSQRVEWGSHVEFILMSVGFAVGLGNIWRFPYLCYKNGGGAFLIPYFGSLAVIGIPIYFMELSLGQFASLGPISVWTISPLYKGIGYSAVIINLVIYLYYNVIVSWCMYYFFASMASEVPWATCQHPWNTEYCRIASEIKNISANASWTDSLNNTITKLNLTSPSEEYYYRKVLQMSPGIDVFGTLVWQLSLCLFIAWTIVFCVLIRGISSLGKVVYFTSLFPYLLLTAMLVRGVTLEGAYDGIMFYLTPVWSRLADVTVWSDALTQICYSLSLFNGGLIAMSSYNQFHNNCRRDSILVPIINCMTSFYGGFATFSILGYMAFQKGVTIDDVAASGPGLIFVVYPEGLSTMPTPPFWGCLFFFMMLTLGLSTMFSMTECFFCAFMDEFPWLLRKTRRREMTFRIVATIIFFLIGLTMTSNAGFYIFSIIDAALSGFPLLITGVFEVAVVIYIYGHWKFSKDIELMLGHKPGLYFNIFWIIAPIILLATLIFYSIQYVPYTLFDGEYVYPHWAGGITWLILIVSVIWIPIFALYVYCKSGGFKVLMITQKPTSDWGPALLGNQTGKYAKEGKLEKPALVDAYNEAQLNGKTPERDIHLEDKF